ncbi:hypothetical protein V8C86DRAFT_1366345 [Haematococcus lacustris]
MSKEINEAMSRSYEVPEDVDESDLMAELDGLEEELSMEAGAKGATPSYLQVSAAPEEHGCAVCVGQGLGRSLPRHLLAASTLLNRWRQQHCRQYLSQQQLQHQQEHAAHPSLPEGWGSKLGPQGHCLPACLPACPPVPHASLLCDVVCLGARAG